jgi:hypothetical protein
MPPAGSSVLAAEPYWVSVSFGHITQNSLPSGRPGQSRTPRQSARCPPGAPQRERLLNLLFAVLSAAGQAEVHPVLDRLGIGGRHEAHAGRRVLAGPDDDLALTPGQDLPAGCLGPEPGQSGQVVSASDDVMTSSRHAVGMHGLWTAFVVDQIHACYRRPDDEMAAAGQRNRVDIQLVHHLP